jgi:hypothetical protein
MISASDEGPRDVAEQQRDLEKAKRDEARDRTNP